jgi:hypothetical protein
VPTLDLVIASRNPHLLDGLRALSALGNFRIAAEAQNPEETFHLVRLYQPHALVVEDDLVVRDATLIGRCRLSLPTLKIILLEGPVDSVHPPNSADAFVRRTNSLAHLARVIESVFAHEIE